MQKYWWLLDRVLLVLYNALLVYALLFNASMMIIYLSIICMFAKDLIVRPLAEKNNPEHYKKLVRPTRVLYTMLSTVLYISAFFVPTIVLNVFGKMSIGWCKFLFLLIYAAALVLAYKNYQWRTMHKDTVTHNKTDKDTNKSS